MDIHVDRANGGVHYFEGKKCDGYAVERIQSASLFCDTTNPDIMRVYFRLEDRGDVVRSDTPIKAYAPMEVSKGGYLFRYTLRNGRIRYYVLKKVG